MWQTDSPDWVEGRYVWCRTKTVTKSGVISYSDASCITGNTGAQGDRGIPGINGENGQTSYLHIAYANSAEVLVALVQTIVLISYISDNILTL